MINRLNIPTEALINTPISKKLFAEKAAMSAAEKRLLREEIESITMRGLLQTRTVGVATHSDDEYLYDQIIVAEVKIKNKTKAGVIAAMVQRAFPVPMILLLESDEEYCMNWCVKRINQADRSKRVIEQEKTTRFFATDSTDSIVNSWLRSLDVTQIRCSTLKELFDTLCHRLMMLEISDEAGVYVEAESQDLEQQRLLLSSLAENREQQRKVSAELKTETQFNVRLKLTTRLKELQVTESETKNRMKK